MPFDISRESLTITPVVYCCQVGQLIGQGMPLTPQQQATLLAASAASGSETGESAQQQQHQQQFPFLHPSVGSFSVNNFSGGSISAASMVQRGQPSFSQSVDPSLVVPAGSSAPVASLVKDSRLTGRSPIVLYMSCDDESLSEYQCLVRKNIELFEATQIDADSNAQGRNKPIVMGKEPGKTHFIRRDLIDHYPESNV